MATARKPNVVGVGIQNQVQPDMATAIEKNIAVLADSEKITKKVMSILSRDLLTYIVLNGSPDVAMANRFLSVLTPMNRRTAILFFGAFLPHKVDGEAEHIVGGKLKGDDRINKKVEATKNFLSNADNDIWTWASQNVEMKEKDTDWGAMIERNIKNAKEKGGMSEWDVLFCVLNAGVSVSEMMKLVQFKETEADKPLAEIASNTPPVSEEAPEATIPEEDTKHVPKAA